MPTLRWFLAEAKYVTRAKAVAALETVWGGARHQGEFDHMGVALLPWCRGRHPQEPEIGLARMTRSNQSRATTGLRLTEIRQQDHGVRTQR